MEAAIANHRLFTPKDMKLEQSTAAPMSTYRYGTGMSGFLEMDSELTEWEKVELYLFIV